jgi:hypothetical protein
VAWTYFTRKGNEEKRQGVYHFKAEATAHRDADEAKGRLCSCAYYASNDGLRTTKGEVDINTGLLMKPME